MGLEAFVVILVLRTWGLSLGFWEVKWWIKDLFTKCSFEWLCLLTVAPRV